MFGMPASFRDIYESALPSHGARRVIAETFEGLGWPVSELESGAMTSTLGPSLGSWGEVVTVEVLDNGLIAVESACWAPFQVFDWGKNRRNVIQFISKLHLNEVWYLKAGAGSEDEGFEKDSSSRVDKLFTDSER